jgi:hypothetical protein
MSTKRKDISKKLRFEVFKRDSFTCQYCGRKSPDVVLHVDHITPVSKGGKNTLMNLVTSCYECNLGKGAEPLSEQSSVEKSRRQAEMLQARREQISMIRDWHISLADQDEEEVDALDDLFNQLTGGKFSMAEEYRLNAKKIIRKFGLSEAMKAMRDGFNVYDDPAKVLEKLGGICAGKRNPFYRKRAYIVAILENRAPGHFNRGVIISLLNRGYEAGGDEFARKVENWAKTFEGSWTLMRDILEGSVKKWEAVKNG